MTEKQKRFADEYLIDLNATRAYMAVYKNCKSENSAAVCASKLLRNAKVKAYIEEQVKQIQSEKIATARDVMEHLTAVMNGEVKEQTLIWIGDGEQDITEIAVSEKDRLKAAELLGKRYGLFTDNVKLDGTARVIFEGEGELDE
jgi:phage terminase small subunit